MHFVFLAAGKGSRIFGEIKTNKCLIKLHDQTIIEKLIKNIPKKNKITIVTGFNKKEIMKKTKRFGVNYIHNRKFKKTEMVETLRLALENIDDDICFSYSDIVYDKKLIKALLKKKIKKNIILPINLNWKNTWNIRKKPILIDAESLILKNNFVIEIGKKIENPRDVHGQFMGILLIPRLLRKKLLQKLKNKIFEKYQTTKLLNNLILDNFKIEALKSKYHWYEFDDYDDLTNYKKEFKI